MTSTAQRIEARLRERLSPSHLEIVDDSAKHVGHPGAAAGGGHVLKATVTAPAEAGRANEALLHLLARAWHLPRRDLSIIAGSTSRNKVVRVAGDPQRLVEQVAPEIARLPGG